MTSGIDQTPPPVPPPPAEPKPNSFSRLAGVIMAPNDTFASIARRPDWVVPLILWMVLSLAGGIIMAQKVDFGAAARAALEGRTDIPADRMDSSIRMASAIGKMFAYCAPIVVIIILLIIAGILHLAFRLFGGEGTFRQSFAATVYAWTPNVIQSVLVYIVVLARGGIDATQMETILRSNLGFLFSMKTNPMAYALMASLDVFTFWTLALFVIAFAYAMRTSKGKAAGIVIPIWAVYVLFKLIPAAMRSMGG